MDVLELLLGDSVREAHSVDGVDIEFFFFVFKEDFVMVEKGFLF